MATLLLNKNQLSGRNELHYYLVKVVYRDFY